MDQPMHHPWGHAAHAQQHAAFPPGYEQAAGGPPQAPGRLTAQCYQNNHATLTWGRAKGADGYIILRGSQPGNMQPIAAVAECAFIDTTTQPGRTYFYCITAYNQHGKSRPCEHASVTLPAIAAVQTQPREQSSCYQSAPAAPKAPAPPEPPPLQAPSGLRAFAHGSRYIGLHWQPLHSGAEYRIYRSESPWSDYAMVGETSETHYLDAVPEPMTKYYYFVQAAHNGRTSQASAMAEAETFPPLPAPETPQNLRCAPQDNDTVELRWNHARAAAAYVVYARLGQGDEFSVIGHTLDCVYLHKEVPQDAYVEYRVQAYHDTAASEPSVVCGGRGGSAPRKASTGTQKRYPNLSWQGFK